MNHTRRQLLDVFLTKLKYNLKSEASKTYLGYLWWVLEPALYVAVLYLVFGTFRARGGPDFVIFLVVGKIPFLWFSKSVTHSTNAIMTGRGLINQVQISKAFFPLLEVFQDLVKQTFVFLLMFFFLALYGLEPQWIWVLVLFVVLTQLLLIIACSLIAAAITPFVPDFRYIVATGMILLMLTSGIFFDYTKVILPKHWDLFLLNPVANLLKNYRQVLMDGMAPDWWALFAICAFSVVVIGLMLQAYRAMDTAFARQVAG